jgi:HK97 family phage portal protein
MYAPRRLRALPRDVPSTVDADESDGDTYVMYDGGAPAPPLVERWDGWPVEWSTPTWGTMVGLSEMTRRVSTVFAAVDKQARILSTMPPYRTKGNVVQPRLAWMRNPQPGVYTGWIEFFRQVVYSYLGSGEVFLWATDRFRESARISSFVMLNPSWVRVEADGELRRFWLNNVDITRDVLHVRYASWPGDPRGHGPLEAAVRSMYGAAALEQYQADLAGRGGIPWGVITAPGRLTANQAHDMRSQYVASRLGARGAPAVFSGGATLEPFNISPRDMALLELRQFDEARIAVLLGVPPHLLGLPSGGDSLTYSTVEGIYDYHWRSSLRPFAAELMEAIGAWIFADPDEWLEVNRDEYVRPPIDKMAAVYATLHGIVETDELGVERRVLSVDQIQAALRLQATSAPATSLAVPA